jgi:hypothetical protein
MGFKDYLEDKDIDNVIVKPKKAKSTKVKETIVEKTIVKEVEKPLSSYSESELVNEINNRKVNKQKKMNEQRENDPLAHASSILDGGDFSEGGSSRGNFDKQDDMMQHALGLF